MIAKLTRQSYYFQGRYVGTKTTYFLGTGRPEDTHEVLGIKETNSRNETLVVLIVNDKLFDLIPEHDYEVEQLPHVHLD